MFVCFWQVEDIIGNLPQEKQILMFSATIPSSIESIAAKMLVNPVYVSIGPPSTPNPSVKQVVMWVEDKSKKKHLFSILQDSRHFKPPVVVFVASKMGADLLAEAVQKVHITVTMYSQNSRKSPFKKVFIIRGV